MSDSYQLKKSTFTQDKIAGGVERRKLRIKSGDVVTVSLVASGSKPPYRVIMRFKSGATIQREVGRFDVASPFEAVELAWSTIRQNKTAEQFGWEWIISSDN